MLNNSIITGRSQLCTYMNKANIHSMTKLKRDMEFLTYYVKYRIKNFGTFLKEKRIDF